MGSRTSEAASSQAASKQSGIKRSRKFDTILVQSHGFVHSHDIRQIHALAWQRKYGYPLECLHQPSHHIPAPTRMHVVSSTCFRPSSSTHHDQGSTQTTTLLHTPAPPHPSILCTHTYLNFIHCRFYWIPSVSRQILTGLQNDATRAASPTRLACR